MIWEFELFRDGFKIRDKIEFIILLNIFFSLIDTFKHVLIKLKIINKNYEKKNVFTEQLSLDIGPQTWFQLMSSTIPAF